MYMTLILQKNMIQEIKAKKKMFWYDLKLRSFFKTK
jgi:hypothetical protein